MSDIPKTHATFSRWLDQHRAEFPPDLLAKAERVKLTLNTLERLSDSDLRAMRERGGESWTGIVGDLTAFAEAYGAWKAKENG